MFPGGAVFFYHYDGLGSTRSLSDVTGTFTDEYDYEAFGELLASTGSTDNSYLFTGEQYDAGLDNYYLRARYYDQSTSRFTQMDTWLGLSVDPASLHKYLYVNAEPVNSLDPSGNITIKQTLVALNAVVSLASTAQSAVDIFSSFQEGQGIGIVEVGLVTMAGLGGFKLFKIVGKKFIRRFNCGKPNEKPICNIFKSDKKRIRAIRRALGLVGDKRKNVAFGDYITSVGIGSMVANSGVTLPFTVGIPQRTFQTGWVDGYSRRFDSEVKLYETLVSRGISAKTIGVFRLVSERELCTSCSRVSRVFRGRYPGIFLLTKGVIKDPK